MREFVRRIIGCFKKKENMVEKMHKPLFGMSGDEDFYLHIKDCELNPTNGTAAIYARVATNENNGLQRQIEMLEKQAEFIGDVDCMIYSEVASGLAKTQDTRTELFRLMADIEAGLVTRVYIECRDRIARDHFFGRETERKLKELKVEVVEIL